MTDRAVIDTTTQNQGPSLQESHDALVKEGVIQGETTDQNDDGVSQGDKNGAGADERPSWLPEKFKTPEDMAKAYSELEKKQSQGKPKDAPADDKAGDEASKAADDAVKSAGLDMGSLQAEYDETGELSDESYAALEKAGIPRDMVDAYIEGLEARATAYSSSMKALVGGDEAYDAMIEWAKNNLTDDEIEAYDDAVNSFDPKTAKAAVQGLNARMQLAEGSPPARRVDGRGVSSDVYESQAQIEADMNDPRYASDEAFRQKVYAKMARSNI